MIWSRDGLQIVETSSMRERREEKRERMGTAGVGVGVKSRSLVPLRDPPGM